MTGDAPLPPLIVIVGPPAAGKTRLALDIAQALGGEVIGADSRQVYRWMDIGTAKPTPDEIARIPHHLIDVVDPDDTLSLAQFQHMAYAAINDVLARGRVPLLVGGTGQYVSAVIEGWSIPEVPPNEALRTELETYAAAHGSQALHQRLHALDPDLAAKIDHQNVRRVVRALEVCIETGQAMSLLQRKVPPPYRMHRLGLTMDREQLYQRADQRLDAMIAAGFLDEVRSLLARGYARELSAMSGIGYAQLAAHLQGEIPLAQALHDTRTLTHDFIRRQYTWFRKYNEAFMWHNGDGDLHPIIDTAATWLKQTVE